jgi:hypothetical protein
MITKTVTREHEHEAPPVELEQALVTQDDVYEGTAGLGMDGATADDFGRPPQLRILQSNSPEVNEAEGAYVVGAKAGMIIDTGTKEVFDGKVGITFIPVSRDHQYVQWHQRVNGGAGGGFVKVLAVSDPIIAELKKAQGAFNKLILPDQDELVETFPLFGLAIAAGLADEQCSPAMIAFASTQIKKYQMLMQRLNKYMRDPRNPPMWAWRWNFGTQSERNKKGSFYGWRINLANGNPADSMLSPRSFLVGEAKAFYQQIREGRVTADYVTAGQQPENEDDIPF